MADHPYNMAAPGNSPGQVRGAFAFVLNSGPWESRLRCNHAYYPRGTNRVMRCDCGKYQSNNKGGVVYAADKKGRK